jgi:TPR repeat protein
LPERTPPAVEAPRAALDEPVATTEEQKVLEQTDPQSAFERARALYAGPGSRRNASAAAALYREAATDGHAPAQYHLGVMYGNGEGVARDEKRAVQWLTRAAQSGLRDAKYNLILAKIFGPEPDMSEAARIARELAEQEYAPVYRILGWMYNTGTGVNSSFTQSVRWSVKTMMGDVTGRAHRPERVVERWERRLDVELAKIWASGPPEVK